MDKKNLRALVNHIELTLAGIRSVKAAVENKASQGVFTVFRDAETALSRAHKLLEAMTGNKQDQEKGGPHHDA